MSHAHLPTHFDVAIVGAGPSGAVSAALLARRGARVVLLDPSHPREKPCGGGVTRRALMLLQEHLGLSEPAGVVVRAARFLDGTRQHQVRVPLEAGNRLLVVSRRVFDHLLLDCATGAGALVVQTRVLDVEPRRPFTIATSAGTRFSADFVVGADGPNSIVRRRLGSPFGRHELSMATGVYAEGVTSEDIAVEMVANPKGYIWSFPRPDHLAIGICAQASETTATVLQARMHAWLGSSALKEQIASASALRKYSWPIPSLPAGGFDHLQLGGERWLTIGDAAGLVDPITREGIFFAIQSGIFAAEAIARGLEQGPAEYIGRVRAEIVDDLRMAATLKSRFFAPAFSALLTDALEGSDRIRSVMADLVAGTQPYRTLKRRLLGTFELGLAWKLFRQRQRSAW